MFSDLPSSVEVSCDGGWEETLAMLKAEAATTAGQPLRQGGSMLHAGGAGGRCRDGRFSLQSEVMQLLVIVTCLTPVAGLSTSF